MSDMPISAPPRSAEIIKQEAGAWLERRDRPDWSANDQHEFDAWLGQSPAHLLAYHRVAEAWKQTERLVVFRRPGPERAKAPGPTRSTIVKFSAAALFLIGVLATGSLYYLNQPTGRSFATALGGHKIITLSDGSRIELNTDTVVTVDMTAGRRMAALEKGEAYFDIAHDASRPFTVKVANRRITVLGTKFRVLGAPGKVEVALLDGRVWFDTEAKGKRAQSALMSPGQVLVATANGIKVTSAPVASLENDLSWRSGMLVFRRTALADAAREYNRYNTKKIVIADSDVAKLTISGILPAKDLNAFTHMTKTFFGLHVQDRGAELVLSR